MTARRRPTPRRGRVVGGPWARGRPRVPTLNPRRPRRRLRLDGRFSRVFLGRELRGYGTCWKCRDDRAADALVQPADRKGRPGARPGGVCLEVVAALEARLDGVERVYDEVYRERGDGAGLEAWSQLTS